MSAHKQRELAATGDPIPSENAGEDQRLRCAVCGATDIRRSKRHGFVEWLLKHVWVVPWRCMRCKHRFFKFR